ncbi:MAG: AbrB/MazE/SpoVT family DNA-binding domain-containing protein [Acidobacteria bacterium]|nr:AbrB/MazE/SpoVT family DNA-binding domain-containing protein [Acidobacteriota bacterium]
MQSVTVSPKFQIVIPKTIRKALQLRPGQKLRIVEYAGRIELVPEREISELRGFVKGIDTDFRREEDRA